MTKVLRNMPAINCPIEGCTFIESARLCCSTCNQRVDFTVLIVKDVMISGIADDEFKREVLGWHELDERSTEETVTFFESKEMTRDALNKHSSTSTTAAISSYKRNQPATDSQSILKTRCRDYQTEMDKLSWSRREKKLVECSLCLSCWTKINKQEKKRTQYPNNSETGAITICGITSSKPIVLDHHLFNIIEGWCKAESMSPPTLNLTVDISSEDCTQWAQKRQ